MVPGTDDTVDETCHLARCEGVVLEVAAVVDGVELLDAYFPIVYEHVHIHTC